MFVCRRIWWHYLFARSSLIQSATWFSHICQLSGCNKTMQAGMPPARRNRLGPLRVSPSHSTMLPGSCASIRTGATASRAAFVLYFLLVATFPAVASAQCTFPGPSTCVNSACVQLKVFSFCDCPKDRGSFDCSVPANCTQQPTVRCGDVLNSQSTSAETEYFDFSGAMYSRHMTSPFLSIHPPHGGLIGMFEGWDM